MKRKNLVVDSSVAVKWVNSQNEKYLKQADKVLKDVENDKATLFMPELSKYEIGNALLNKKMSLPGALASLATVYSIPIQFVGQSLDEAGESMQIAYDQNITFYDATFLSLAKKLKAILVTDNPKHQKIPKGYSFRVVSLKNYR